MHRRLCFTAEPVGTPGARGALLWRVRVRRTRGGSPNTRGEVYLQEAPLSRLLVHAPPPDRRETSWGRGGQQILDELGRRDPVPPPRAAIGEA